MRFQFDLFAYCRAFIPLIAFTMSGCQTADHPSVANALASALSLQPHENPGPAITGSTPVITPGESAFRVSAVRQERIPFLTGTGRFIGAPQSVDRDISDANEETVTINLVGVSIPHAAKVILGDILGGKYSIAPGIEGKITIQTPKPVARSSAVDLFQTALRSNGAAVVDTGEQFKIVPADQAAVGAGIRIQGMSNGKDRLGSQVQIVQLQYVSAGEIRRLLEPISPRGSIVRADEARNTITLSGTKQEIASILEAISIFDIDVMKGMSFALVPVTTAQPEAVADELRTVFASERDGPMLGMVRFVPNKQLSAILVISPQPKYLKRAAEWVRRFDARAEGSEKKIFTYAAQNRRAQEIVEVLQSMFANEAGAARSLGTQRNVTPQHREATVQSGPSSSGFPSMGGSRTSGGNLSPSTPAPTSLTQNRALQTPSAPNTTLGPPTFTSASDASQEQRFKLAVDEGRNSILIEATPIDYRRIMKVVRTLDVMPKQVLIEVTIAEVSLNDELKFGVRWFLKDKGSNSFTFTDAASGAISSVFPGFSYAITAANAVATLNALNGITDVNVISSPSLTVMDNRTAYLQIGDEVPITTQSAVSVSTTGAPIVNSISYKDTGIILMITPRINASGRVLLDLEQEVSSVVNTTSSGIDSPTIRQRRIKTAVVVNNGEALTLGGLIESGRTVTRTQVPIFGDISILGNAFKHKNNKIEKKELIIMIAPLVMRNLDEARWITDEFRKELRRILPPSFRGPRTVEQTIRRTFE